MDVTEAELQRFLRKVDKKDTGCWEWKGFKNENGYPRMRLRYKYVYAHRFSCLALKDVDPTGFQVHHICENIVCVNPEHLEALTPREHIAKTPRSIGFIAISTDYCSNGHKLTEDNLQIWKNGRHCKQCKKEWAAKRFKANPSQKSPYCGVNLKRSTGKWVSRYYFCGRTIHLGSFEDIKEAARAWNNKALELHGPNAYLHPL